MLQFTFFLNLAVWIKELSNYHSSFEIYVISPSRTGSKGLETEIQVSPKGFLLLLFETYKVGFQLFLVVSEVPDLCRKLREARKKNFPQVLSKSALVTPGCFNIKQDH